MKRRVTHLSDCQRYEGEMTSGCTCNAWERMLEREKNDVVQPSPECQGVKSAVSVDEPISREQVTAAGDRKNEASGKGADILGDGVQFPGGGTEPIRATGSLQQGSRQPDDLTLTPDEARVLAEILDKRIWRREQRALFHRLLAKLRKIASQESE